MGMTFKQLFSDLLTRFDTIGKQYILDTSNEPEKALKAHRLEVNTYKDTFNALRAAQAAPKLEANTQYLCADGLYWWFLQTPWDDDLYRVMKKEKDNPDQTPVKDCSFEQAQQFIAEKGPEL